MLATLATLDPQSLATCEPSTEDDAVALWLANVHGRSGSDRTIAAYTAALDRFRSWLGPRPLASVTIPVAVGYATWLRHESCLATSSQAQALAALRSMYSFWSKLGLVQLSPFAAVPQPRVSCAGAARMLPADELRSMLAVATPRQRAVVLLVATTGLRVEEACAARWEHVYRDPGGNVGLHVVGKGGEERDAKLLPAVVDALRAASGSDGHADEQTCDVGRPGGAGDASGYLLPMRTRQAVDQMLERLCKRAGVRHVSCHWLRHFFATEALYAGADLLRVQDDMGHASLSTTRRYLHAAKGLQKTSADFVARALGIE